MDFIRSLLKSGETKPKSPPIAPQSFSYLAQQKSSEKDDEDNEADNILDDYVVAERSAPEPSPKSPPPKREDRKDRPPLDATTWRGYRDKDGRIIDEIDLRTRIFQGGIDVSIRPDVWSFLYDLYPLSSTQRERDVMAEDYLVRYCALKKRWQTMLHLVSAPNALPFPPAYMTEHDDDEDEDSDDDDDDIDQNEDDVAYLHAKDHSVNQTEVVTCTAAADVKREEQYSFVELQAQVFAGRQPIDLATLKKAIRIIDKDVPRTDRDQPIFRSNQNLGILRDVLITYAAFHPDVSYVQGMNDIASRFLTVFKSEVETYWCLERYIDKIKDAFLEKTMLEKTTAVAKLLKEMDEELYRKFEDSGLPDLVFCHRWLILCFKREFTYQESLTIFEVLSSCHLELTSLAADEARREIEAKTVLQQEGWKDSRMTDVKICAEYTFELFVCVAILMEHRERILQCDDCNQVFQCVSKLSMELDKDVVLQRSEELFYTYCHKSVLDCFPKDPAPAT
ncbi:TBC1 domain family member 15-like [Oscarella lobularis]|uniref:TBC1 domain family member 15-like n=1 Tax=Oscarella lobularis TaxID=121494 RepID=UPI0033143F14